MKCTRSVGVPCTSVLGHLSWFHPSLAHSAASGQCHPPPVQEHPVWLAITEFHWIGSMTTVPLHGHRCKIIDPHVSTLAVGKTGRIAEFHQIHQAGKLSKIKRNNLRSGWPKVGGHPPSLTESIFDLPTHLSFPPTWASHPHIWFIRHPPTQITSQNRKIASLNPEITFCHQVVFKWSTSGLLVIVYEWSMSGVLVV